MQDLSDGTPARGSFSTRKPSPWAAGLVFSLFAVFIATLLYAGYFVYASARQYALNLDPVLLSDALRPAVTETADVAGVADVTTPEAAPVVATLPSIPVVIAPASVSEVQPTAQVATPLANGRYNILVMGIDQRPDEKNLADRTDTMILFTIDTNTGQVGMLSVPRDLYVHIPAPVNQYGKINTAHFFGEVLKPGSGPGLAKATVREFTGQPVQYYVRLNFHAFRALIDAIGGIDIDVPKAIRDDNYPDDNCPDSNHCGYAPFYIAAGHQHMNGTVALKYARTRYTDSDFYRARRQQQVILAVRDKILQANMLPTLLSQLPTLYNELHSSLSTDLSPAQMVALVQAVMSNQLDVKNMRQLVIDETLAPIVVDPQAGDIDQPIMSKIRPALAEFFGTGPVKQIQLTPFAVQAAALPTPDNAARQQLLLENARIELLNGTGQKGLATRTAQWLQAAGYTVVGVADADRFYDRTEIIDVTGKSFTRERLRELCHVGSDRVFAEVPNGQVANADLRIIVGQDFQLPPY